MTRIGRVFRTISAAPTVAGAVAGAVVVCTISAATVSAAEPLEGLEGPDITIISGEERTIYEYRQNGYLRMVKIVPNWGRPYYLVPDTHIRPPGDLNQSERLVPSWIIVEF